MVKLSKVEKSEHFDEIVKLLSEGRSSRFVSNYLKNEYGEVISYSAINNYKNKHIHMEGRVEAELNRRAEVKQKREAEAKAKAKAEAEAEAIARVDDIKNITEREVQHQADKLEYAENTFNVVAETIADNMEGVARVASQFPEKFEHAYRDSLNPESGVTSKDVARLALDANKLYNEYFKQDNASVEVNVDNSNINDLSSLINEEKVRARLNERRGIVRK